MLICPRGMCLSELTFLSYLPLKSLHIKVDQREKGKSQSKVVVNTTDLSSMVNDKNIRERLLACRSIKIILTFFPCFKSMENSWERGIFVQLEKIR